MALQCFPDCFKPLSSLPLWMWLIWGPEGRGLKSGWDHGEKSGPGPKARKTPSPEAGSVRVRRGLGGCGWESVHACVPGGRFGWESAAHCAFPPKAAAVALSLRSAAQESALAQNMFLGYLTFWLKCSHRSRSTENYVPLLAVLITASLSPVLAIPHHLSDSH